MDVKKTALCDWFNRQPTPETSPSMNYLECIYLRTSHIIIIKMKNVENRTE